VRVVKSPKSCSALQHLACRCCWQSPCHCRLDGFDISLAQAPASEWLPANVKLREWDMITDPPAELVGQYDIVHVRLITLVIKDNNGLPIVRNLRKLLSKIPLVIPSPSHALSLSDRIGRLPPMGRSGYRLHISRLLTPRSRPLLSRAFS
jgi:hypothetical protein